jgi:hypothetical protein
MIRFEQMKYIAVAAHARTGALERASEWALAKWSEGAALATLAGEALLRAAPALRGRIGPRASALMNLLYSTSGAALPIVALINMLVGAIAAVVVGTQLRQR